jgi:hypothetical protein
VRIDYPRRETREESNTLGRTTRSGSTLFGMIAQVRIDSLGKTTWARMDFIEKEDSGEHQ